MTNVTPIDEPRLVEAEHILERGRMLVVPGLLAMLTRRVLDRPLILAVPRKDWATFGMH